MGEKVLRNDLEGPLLLEPFLFIGREPDHALVAQAQHDGERESAGGLVRHDVHVVRHARGAIGNGCFLCAVLRRAGHAEHDRAIGTEIVLERRPRRRPILERPAQGLAADRIARSVSGHGAPLTVPSSSRAARRSPSRATSSRRWRGPWRWHTRATATAMRIASGTLWRNAVWRSRGSP